MLHGSCGGSISRFEIVGSGDSTSVVCPSSGSPLPATLTRTRMMPYTRSVQSRSVLTIRAVHVFRALSDVCDVTRRCVHVLLQLRHTCRGRRRTWHRPAPTDYQNYNPATVFIYRQDRVRAPRGPRAERRAVSLYVIT